MPTASDQVIGIYQRQAKAWVQFRNTDLIEKDWLQKFLKLMPNGNSILDLGCGFGDPIGRFLIEKGYRLTGVDTSPELIEIAQQEFPNDTWLVSDMRSLKLDRQFDGIIAWNSFFHLPHNDQRHMFEVFKQHARPNAPLMFTTGPSFGEAFGQFEGEELYHASLDASEYQSLLMGHGFKVIDHIVEDETCGNLTIWLAQFG